MPVTVSKLQFAIARDRVLSKVCRYVKNGWPPEVSDDHRPYRNRQYELTVEEGCVMWGTRVLIPVKLQQRLLCELHVDHPGATRMKAIARSYLWWPGLDKDIERMSGSCVECKRAKKAPPTAPLQPWSWPSRPWQRVHLDFAGPFQGVTFLLAIDAYSKWPEVRVMKCTTALKTLEVLRDWFSSHGIPHRLVTDNGPQFVAQEFADFCKNNRIRHTKSAPYHPASIGLVERFVQTLKQSLKATTVVSPSELLRQRHLNTRLDLIQPDPNKTVLSKQDALKQFHDGRTGMRTWSVEDKVMVLDFLLGRSWTAAVVTRVLGPVTYLVETSEGLKWKRHADQIKGLAEPAVPTESSEEPEAISELSPPSPDASGPTLEDDLSGDSNVREESIESDPEDPTDEVPTQSRYPARVHHPPDYYGH